jgi:hypothetical protein
VDRLRSFSPEGAKAKAKLSDREVRSAIEEGRP